MSYGYDIDQGVSRYDPPVDAVAFWISVPLVFVVGMAIQRGNTCTVVAFDDVIHHRSAVRFLAIVYTWLWVAGGLALLRLATGFTPHAKLFPVTVWSVVGGALLGVGAVVNGGCTTGAVARVGSGEYAFVLTFVGFFVGCALTPRVFGPAAVNHMASMPTTTSLAHPVVALIGFAAVVLINARRLLFGGHESFRGFLRNAWDPRTATMILGVLFAVLVQLVGPWSYTELLGDTARGVDEAIAARLVLFAALLAGAIVAGRSLRGARLIGPLAPRVIRCSLGGLIMGAGFSIAPGSFDGLTLFGQPLLLPFAWVVMGVSYVAILLGVLYLRSKLGGWVKTRRG